MEKTTLEPRTVLLVSARPGVENLAAALSEGALVPFEIARSRRAAVAALRRQAFSAVIVDVGLQVNEVTQTEIVWQNVGAAVQLELNLSILKTGTVILLLQSVLSRRSGVEAKMREHVTRSMAGDLRSTVTGMLLEADLALSDRTLPSALQQRFRQLRLMADDLSIRLRAA